MLREKSKEEEEDWLIKDIGAMHHLNNHICQSLLLLVIAKIPHEQYLCTIFKTCVYTPISNQIYLPFAWNLQLK